MKELDGFLKHITARYSRQIDAHRRLNVPMNFSIEDGYIKYEGGDWGEVLHRYSNLYKTMEYISIYVNNELDCGCVFTIGF